MADIDCSAKSNVVEKRKMMTSKQMNSLLGKSKDHDPKSPHPDRIQQKHKGTMKHQCKVGIKTNKQSKYSKIHMRVHTGEKPYQCKICDKYFTQKSDLKKHIFTHTGEKPYHCEVCNKYFSSLFNLKVHTHIHTGERPYQCKVCDKCFIDSNPLNVTCSYIQEINHISVKYVINLSPSQGT